LANSAILSDHDPAGWFTVVKSRYIRKNVKFNSQYYDIQNIFGTF
jgi:hypothetical protein